MMRTAAAALLTIMLATACSHLDEEIGGSFLSGIARLFTWNERSGNAERGRATAAEKCAACHTLTSGGGSHPGRAASFPELSARSVLTTTRLNKVLSRFPHPMPPIVLAQGDVRDLIAFLRLSAVMPSAQR